MQLDADDDDVPFFKPQPVPTEPIPTSKTVKQQAAGVQDSMVSVDTPEASQSTEPGAAAAVTAEQED